MHKHDLLMHKKWFKASAWTLIAAFLGTSVLFVGQNAALIRTSILPSVMHAPFNGTVMPIQKAPKWSSLTEVEYKSAYTQIPESKMQATPIYNPEDFKTPFSSLKWGDHSTENLRNEKITYSVPYMGNYTLDSTEYAGSHLAVDIKIPMGTPVFAIGNGKVIKVANQPSGFGHHVVIEHDNFPSIENQNVSTTYYSAYCHLDTMLVSEGEIVTKGQQIGLSGQSGTATTPHLHFQIDNDNADWHPFWPFTWQEVQSAGLNFWSAVNAGLGKDLALSTTINPMMYVQKYLNSDGANFTIETTKSTETTTDQPVNTQTETAVPPTTTESSTTTEPIATTETYVPETSAIPSASQLNAKVTLRNSYDAGDVAYATIELIDQNGEIHTNMFDGVITVSLTNSVGEVTKTILTYDDFKNGSAQVKIKDLSIGSSKVMVAYGDSNFYSDSFDVVEKVVATENFSSGAYSDISDSSDHSKAIAYLSEKGVISGYPDGTFRPDATVTRAEALKFILEGMKSPFEVDNVPFKDVADNDWSFKYVSTSVKRSIVNGYKDGTFKGGNTINKAEFLKMLFTATGDNISSSVRDDPFLDVDKKEWFAKYFDYAKKKNILDSDLRAWPNTGMKRGDVAEAIYRVMKMNEAGGSKYDGE